MITDPVLEENRDDPWVFVQFSDVNKLGIHPMSDHFDTPLAIYGWPIVVMYDEIRKQAVPYASNRRFMIVFEVKPEYRDQVVVLNSPGGFDWQEATNDFWVYLKEIEMENANLADAYEDLWWPNDPTSFWNSTRETMQYAMANGMEAREAQRLWRSLLVKIGLYGFVDFSDDLYESEPQGLFFSSQGLNLLGIVDTERGKGDDAISFFKNSVAQAKLALEKTPLKLKTRDFRKKDPEVFQRGPNRDSWGTTIDGKFKVRVNESIGLKGTSDHITGTIGADIYPNHKAEFDCDLFMTLDADNKMKRIKARVDGESSVSKAIGKALSAMYYDVLEFRDDPNHEITERGRRFIQENLDVLEQGIDALGG